MKALLVMDLNDESLLNKFGTSVWWYNYTYHTNWFIKKIPERKELYGTTVADIFNAGYNACLTEILTEPTQKKLDDTLKEIEMLFEKVKK